MKFSQILIPTTKEIPNNAIISSHIFLIKAGYIQSVGDSGLYNFLPLGYMVINNIKKIIKYELSKIGAQEVSLSFVTPASLWKKSHRLEKYGKELLKFKDRKNSDYVLGATYEEMMVSLVSKTVKSYKNLPINLYQMNIKFRDEIRPRFGIMRSREFLMKDGYSFHSSEEDMIREFNIVEECYKKIFKELNLDIKVIDADSGAIGGNSSKEFMVISDSGEDTIILCDSCNYASNIEKSTSYIPNKNLKAPEGDFNKFYTPNIKTIDEVKNLFKVDSYFIIKIVVKIAIYNDKKRVTLFALRGSDNLQDVKACSKIGAYELIDIKIDEMDNIGLVTGFIGISSKDKNIDIFFDDNLKNGKNLICGADEKDYHFIGVDLDSANKTFIDIREVQSGDICKSCKGVLKYKKGIEVAHIFQLGTKYSELMNANFLDKNGKSKPFVMGTYGIGISRLMSAIIEQKSDKNGCIWTKKSSPFQIVIIVSNIKKENELEMGYKIYNQLKNKNIDVIIDDRRDRFGTKIKDFELLGFPYALIIGKNLEDNSIELVDRKTLSKKNINIKNIKEEIDNISF